MTFFSYSELGVFATFFVHPNAFRRRRLKKCGGKGQIKDKHGPYRQIIYLSPVSFQKGQIKAKFSKKSKHIFGGQALKRDSCQPWSGPTRLKIEKSLQKLAKYEAKLDPSMLRAGFFDHPISGDSPTHF